MPHSTAFLREGASGQDSAIDPRPRTPRVLSNLDPVCLETIRSGSPALNIRSIIGHFWTVAEHIMAASNRPRDDLGTTETVKEEKLGKAARSNGCSEFRKMISTFIAWRSISLSGN